MPNKVEAESTQAVMNFEIEKDEDGVVGLDPESDNTTGGVIVGWGPPEETDYDLRRRIQNEQFNRKLEARKTRKPRKPRPLADLAVKAEQRAVDGLMGLRMGKNWGRRR